MDQTSEAWRDFASRIIEAVGEFVSTFPDYQPGPPSLEGISIREIEHGPYDGMYEVIGLCRTCNQCVTHLVHPDATGDELHRAFHCECRVHRTEGYYVPRVSASKLFGPTFAADLRDGPGVGFNCSERA